MRHVHVHVTQKDIDQGIGGSGTSCPVAIAIKRRLSQTDPHVIATVLPRSVVLGRRSGWLAVVTAPLPQRVTDWIVAFDKLSNVEPINFTFAMPEVPA